MEIYKWKNSNKSECIRRGYTLIAMFIWINYYREYVCMSKYEAFFTADQLLHPCYSKSSKLTQTS
ncbi:hypothetical protein T07_2185 [Trichinella nelsoni]|uniref:Uncharacterized protein n=1 Tax=Trichinella nelsoni TaxID=6336 RepID=A0A0V0S200_9BILA|nr:hypothetical protein T07_2185 [Trichinella nelsoni]